MSEPKEKAIDLSVDLPASPRQAIADFLALSAETAATPEMLAERLLESIALKACLSDAMRL